MVLHGVLAKICLTGVASDHELIELGLKVEAEISNQILENALILGAWLTRGRKLDVLLEQLCVMVLLNLGSLGLVYLFAQFDQH